jgi:hypothetical protein
LYLPKANASTAKYLKTTGIYPKKHKNLPVIVGGKCKWGINNVGGTVVCIDGTD